MQLIGDCVIVGALLALAVYLHHVAPIHHVVSLKAPQLIMPAQPLPGLLRGQGPNFAASMRDFTGGGWRADGVTVLANADVGPDGERTAFRITETTDANYHRIETRIVNPGAGKTSVLSLFVKAGVRTAIRFEMRDSDPARYGTATFDLQRGTVVSGSVDVSDAGMQQLPNGWFRCWAVMPYATGAAVFNFGLLNGRLDGIYGGDGRSGLLIWGVQFEPGQDGPGGYAE
jgi:hypothetical protein